MVTPGWLERIGACLASDDQIASATPWSNNAEIASIPGFCETNPVPRNPASVAEGIADYIARDGGPQYPELPTAVGFCMGISKNVVDEIGNFDEERFGMGYGEENDFCLRAREKGFRNVLCDDAYVAHYGGRSFGPMGLQPNQKSMQRLLQRHPTYLQEISAYIDADPLAALRERLCAGVIAAGLTFD